MNHSPTFWSFKNEYLSDDQRPREDEEDLSDVNNDNEPIQTDPNRSDYSQRERMMEDTIRKQISLYYMLGIYKLNSVFQKTKIRSLSSSLAFNKINEAGDIHRSVEARPKSASINSSPVLRASDKSTHSPLRGSQAADNTEAFEKLRKNYNQKLSELELAELENNRMKALLESKERSFLEKLKSVKFLNVRNIDAGCQTEAPPASFMERELKSLQDENNLEINFIERKLEMEGRESYLIMKENELQMKMDQYDGMLQNLQNKEREVELRLKELTLEPLNCLLNPEKLKERLRLMKNKLQERFHEYSTNFSFKENVLEDHVMLRDLERENVEFWSLFNEGDSLKNPQEIFKKGILLKNYEKNLLQERLKIDIVANHLKYELELMNQEKTDIGEQRKRFQTLDLYEKTTQQELQLLDKKKQGLLKEKYIFYKEIEVLRDYFRFNGNPGQSGHFEQQLNKKSSFKEELNKIVEEIMGQNESSIKDEKKRVQLINLKRDIRKLQEIEKDGIEAFSQYNSQNMADIKKGGIMKEIDVQKEYLRKEEEMQRAFKRKEDIIAHKQNELHSLKLLLDKESAILQEEKTWIEREKLNIKQATETKIKALEIENRRLKENLMSLRNKNYKEDSGIQKVEKISYYDQKMKNFKEAYHQNYSSKNIPDEASNYASNISETAEIERILSESKGWLLRSFHLNKEKPAVNKRNAFNIWRLHLKDSFMFQRIDQLLQNNEDPDYLRYKWNQERKNLIKDRKYPDKNTSNKQKELEVALLKLERKHFWKMRFSQIFGSILRNRRRRERVLLVVGFLKFCLNCKLLENFEGHRSEKPRPENRNREDKFNLNLNQISPMKKAAMLVSQPAKPSGEITDQMNSGQRNHAQPQNSQPESLRGGRVESSKSVPVKGDILKENTGMSSGRAAPVPVQTKIVKMVDEHKYDLPLSRDFMNSEIKKSTRVSSGERHLKKEEEPSSEIARKEAESHINTLEKNLERKYKKIQAALLIKNMLLKHSIKKSDISYKANAISNWLKLIIIQDRHSFNKELEAILTILNERSFRENLFRTKVKLSQSEIETRLHLLEQGIIVFPKK